MSKLVGQEMTALFVAVVVAVVVVVAQPGLVVVPCLQLVFHLRPILSDHQLMPREVTKAHTRIS